MPGNPTLTAFAASPPPWSLASMDTNFTNIANLLKNANNYSLYLGDTGSANAYAVSFPAGITWSLTNSGLVMVNPANSNTAASTLAVNAGLAKNIFQNGLALTGGEIKAGVPFFAVYDGTQFNMLSSFNGKNVANSAFLAYKSTTSNNVTGNGTTVNPVIFDTAVFNQGTGYGTGTGIFTAPVTGRYQFSCQVTADQIGTATRVDLQLVTSNRTYGIIEIGSLGAVLTEQSFTLDVLADMDAADTAKVTFAISGIGADTADIVGSATVYTFLSGALIC